jgi:hypothetical protein
LHKDDWLTLCIFKVVADNGNYKKVCWLFLKGVTEHSITHPISRISVSAYVMGLNGHNTPETREERERTTILQVDATMSAGVLFFLTLTSFIARGTEPSGRVFTVALTLIAIVPFVVSAILIIRGRTLRMAKNFTGGGFIYLVAVLIMIVLLNVIPAATPVIPVEEQCAKNPGMFNLTNNVWQCSKFSPGSLAEKCALNPKDFNTTKSECSKLIPPPNVT